MVSEHRAGCRYAPRGCDTWFKPHGRSGDTAALEDQPGCSRRVRRTAIRQPLAHTPSIHPSRISPTGTLLAPNSVNTEPRQFAQRCRILRALMQSSSNAQDISTPCCCNAVFVNTSDDRECANSPLESQCRHCIHPRPPSPDMHVPWRGGCHSGLAWRLVFVTAPRARPTSGRAESFNCGADAMQVEGNGQVHHVQ